MILFSSCNNVSKRDGIKDISKNYNLSFSNKKELLLSRPELAMSDGNMVKNGVSIMLKLLMVKEMGIYYLIKTRLLAQIWI